MGADARWVCHTCRTVCCRGGRPMFKGVPKLRVAADVDEWKRKVSDLGGAVEIQDEEMIVAFLDDLRRWLMRHGGHDIHIGSDYTTVMDDLDDYYKETVAGKRSAVTIHEALVTSISAMEETTIREIERVLRVCATELKPLRSVAEELYDKFSRGTQ